MSDLEPIAAVIEEYRLSLVKDTSGWFLFYLALFFLFFILDVVYSSNGYLKLIGALFSAAGITNTLTQKQKKFSFLFKELFITELFKKRFGNNIKYDPNNYIQKDYFISSLLFQHKLQPDRYGGEDFIYASVGGIDIKFSEVYAQYKQEYRTKGRKREIWIDIFRGVFVVTEFKKVAKLPVVVLPSSEKVVSLPWDKLKRVKLEDPEFEKLFDVWSKDQIEARYILSISLMQRMVEFYKKAKEKGFRPEIYFSFIGNKLFCALKPGFSGDFLRVPFYLSTSKRVLMSETHQLYIQEVELILSIIEELNLNLDIWALENVSNRL
ncbi:MAG: DUF3137 domain-containing protein [Aquificaceae bacterium]|nr:DUF3137 domain-containing protein [Aquificaceae bacterium]